VKERLKRILPRVGYVAFFFFALVLSLSWTFPYDKVKERIVASFNVQQKNTQAQQELQIDDLTGYFVTGVKAKGVRILSAPSEAGKPPVEIRIDEARARLQLLPLLIFHKNVKFKLDVLGGTVDGEFGDHGSERVIDLEFEDVEVGKLGPIQQALGIPLEGHLFGTVHFELPQGKASKGNGKVALELRDLALGDGKAKLALGPGFGGIPLQRLAVGTLTIEGEAKDGTLKLSKMKASGKDMDIDGDGRIQMKELANESLVDVTLKLKVADAYKNKNDMTKGLFAAVEFSPDAKAAKMADGFYGLRLLGPLGRLKPAPAGSGGGGSVRSPFGASKGMLPTPSP
jgi:type II secretion system protein N